MKPIVRMRLDMRALRKLLGVEFHALAENLASAVRQDLSKQSAAPSPPGDAPRTVSGNLEASVVVEESRGGMRQRVGSRAPYAAALELGAQRLAARPFLRSALHREWPRLLGEFSRAVASHLRRPR